MNIDGSTKEGGVPSRYVVQKMMMLEVTPKTICHPAPGPRRQTRVNINSFCYNHKECHHLMQRCHLSSTPHLSSSQRGGGRTVKRHPRKIGRQATLCPQALTILVTYLLDSRSLISLLILVLNLLNWTSHKC